MENTIESLIQSSRLPVSIIIVGIGNAEFNSMDVLDADTEPLRNRNGKSIRDCVQFVPFNK